MESIIIQLVKDLVNIDLQEIDIEDLGNNFYQFNDYADHYGWYNSVTQEVVFEVNRDGHYVPSGDTISPEMLMMLNDILDDHHYIDEKGHITYYELEEEDNY